MTSVVENNMSALSGLDTLELESAIKGWHLYSGVNPEDGDDNIVINTPAMWQEYVKGVKNPWSQFSITELAAAEKEGGFGQYLAAVPAGLLGQYVEPHLQEAYINVAPDVKSHVGSYFYGYLNVTIKDGHLKDLLLGGSHIFRVLGPGAEDTFFILRKKEKGVVLLGMKSLEESGEYEAQYFTDLRGKDSKRYFDTLGVKVIEYTPLGGWSSAGQLKKGTYVWAARNLPDFRPWAILNRLTHGMARRQRKWPVPGTLKDLANVAIRQAHGVAPMTKLMPMSGMAVVLGKEGNGSSEHDGFARVRAEYVAKAYSGCNVLVRSWAVEGDVCQCRPNFMTKTLALIVAGQSIEEMLWWSGKYRLHIIPMDQASDYQEAFEEAIFSKGVSGKYALTEEEKARGMEYSVLIFVPSLVDEAGNFIRPFEAVRMVDYVTDLNGLKAPFDLHYGLSGLNPLGFGHSHEDIEGLSKTSTQLVMKMSIKSPLETKKFVEEVSLQEVKGILKEIEELESRELTPRELEGDPQGILWGTCPKFPEECYAPAYRSKVSKAVEGWAKRAQKLQFAVDGLYTKIIPDIGSLWRCDLLGVTEDGAVEIYSPGLEKAGVTEVVGLRYPSQGHEEYAICKVVTHQELLARAQKRFNLGEIGGYEFKYLCRQIVTFQGGGTAIPNNGNLLSLFGGADYDGDGMVFVVNEEVVRILKKGYILTAVEIVK